MAFHYIQKELNVLMSLYSYLFILIVIFKLWSSGHFWSSEISTCMKVFALVCEYSAVDLLISASEDSPVSIS